MIINLVKIYFVEEDIVKEKFSGTSHIYIKDFDIELRGVYFKKRKHFFIIQFPTLLFTPKGSTKRIKAPFLSFRDKDKQKEVHNQIKELIYKAIIDHKNFIINK